MFYIRLIQCNRGHSHEVGPSLNYFPTSQRANLPRHILDLRNERNPLLSPTPSRPRAPRASSSALTLKLGQFRRRNPIEHDPIPNESASESPPSHPLPNSHHSHTKTNE